MHRNLGMKPMLQRAMLEKTQLCQITSRETTGKRKEEGVRVWPCDAEMPAAAQGEASNRWRCSNGHDGQKMAKPPKLPSVGSCRHRPPFGGLPLMQVHFFTSRNRLLCFHTSRERGCYFHDLICTQMWIRFSQIYRPRCCFAFITAIFPSQVTLPSPHLGSSCSKFWLLKK